MEKILITRKEHKCGYCHKVIPKGTKTLYMEGRSPLYDDTEYNSHYGFDGKQTGIEYWKVWYCYEDYNVIPSCSAEDL